MDTIFDNVETEYGGSAIHILNKHVLVNISDALNVYDDDDNVVDWMYSSDTREEINGDGYLVMNNSNLTNNGAKVYGGAIGISRHWMMRE